VLGPSRLRSEPEIRGRVFHLCINSARGCRAPRRPIALPLCAPFTQTSTDVPRLSELAVEEQKSELDEERNSAPVFCPTCDVAHGDPSVSTSGQCVGQRHGLSHIALAGKLMGPRPRAVGRFNPLCLSNAYGRCTLFILAQERCRSAHSVPGMYFRPDTAPASTAQTHGPTPDEGMSPSSSRRRLLSSVLYSMLRRNCSQTAVSLDQALRRVEPGRAPCPVRASICGT